MIPPYFDGLIQAFQRQQTGRFVHLGHWDDFDENGQVSAFDPSEFAQAQARLNAVMLEKASLQSGSRVLDVGCGFGGTLASIDARWQNMTLVGVNIDPRQLGICRQLIPSNGNILHWELADACDLPFGDQQFDRVLCIEAMFHFSSRRRFFLEVARVLKPGGVLVISDIVTMPQIHSRDLPGFAMEALIQDGFGPWPDFWGHDAAHESLASAAGLVDIEIQDATLNTLPSHCHTLPPELDERRIGSNTALRSAAMLAWLHRNGYLRYVYLRAAKPGASS